MDRDEIERRDFPTGRRGYDPEAVDQHLRRVADQFEAQLRAPRPSLAESTSEQVRAILEAAERGASELRAQAGGDVARVQEAAGGMLSKLDALQSELDRLLGALRESGERLTTGLAELQASTAELAAGTPSPPPAAADSSPSDTPALANGSAPANGAAPSTDEAGARLIALNMALGGTPREETARYLAEHFTLADSEALLDDVYARAGG